VSSDAHHPRDFAMLEYGVNQARRGWIEPADVLNTRPLAALRQR
jgi:DNA polymerase (family 10)